MKQHKLYKVAIAAIAFACVMPCFGASPALLFPTDVPMREWKQFNAAGFSKPVSGMIFGTGSEACCGVPLGGLGTGCLDIDTTGVFGFCSVFQPVVELGEYNSLRGQKMQSPFLGISVGGRTWVLADKQFIEGGKVTGCMEPSVRPEQSFYKAYLKMWPVDVPRLSGVSPAAKVSYWGHYPVADIEYMTDSPVSVSLRAWVPFIPGDAGASSIPGAVFEVRLHNGSGSRQSGAMAFNFPGPTKAEVQNVLDFSRKESADKNLTSVTVTAKRSSYTVGVIGKEAVTFGGNLASSSDTWSKIAVSLPSAPESEAGTSAAVKFDLKPGRSKTVRFVLAWRITTMQGLPYDQVKGFDETWTKNEWTLRNITRASRDEYVPISAVRYSSPLVAAEELAANHEALLRRVLAWQQVVYAANELPVWLRDTLVNNLALIPEDSIWMAPKGKIAGWSAPGGAFHLIESPRSCPIVGCIASNWYGDIPITYFFPELDRQILRNYVAYMRPDGAVPFLYPANDLVRATYEWQVGLSGACFAELVHRLWLRTGDDGILKEFYPAVKKNTAFTIELNKAENGIIRYPREGTGQSWWEHTPLYGMVSHLAGVRMAHIEMAKNMSKHMNDPVFMMECDRWLSEASMLTEKYLWNDAAQSYLNYYDKDKNVRQDDIMSSQLDGQWMAQFNGLPGVFNQDRVRAVLGTIKKDCILENGVAGFSVAGKGPDLLRYGTFPPETHIVGMTYMYNGDSATGLDICRRNMDNMVRVQGYQWDLANLIRCDTGARTFGCDYYQNMILWDLPAAMAGKDLSEPCRKGGLVDRMLKAAR